MRLLHYAFISLLFVLSSCKGPDYPGAVAVTSTPAPERPAEAIEYTYQVVNTYPHDPESFTQGLVFSDGIFYESAGLNQDYGGHSSLRRVEITTGNVLQKVGVPEPYFAEGLTLFQGQLFQLTWKEGIGLIYDPKTFKSQGQFKYKGEGWGLTNDGKSIIMSDGSNELRFIDPKDFTEQRRIKVSYKGRPMQKLNELEYVKGEIYANIWQEDVILKIDPKDGKVTGVVDMSGILKPEDRAPESDVLNGIAYDPGADKLYVTGKKWPKLFEIKLLKK